MINLRSCFRWTIEALAKKFHIRRQRVLAILALKVTEDSSRRFLWH